MSNKVAFCCAALLIIATKMVEGSNRFFPCQFESKCSCSFTKQNLIKADCARRGLTYIPTISSKVENISLANNYIRSVENGIFEFNVHLRHLDLSDNNINKLQSRSFKGLLKLETLLISNNRFNYSAISINVFKPLKSLLNLMLKRNFNHTFTLNVSSLMKLQTLRIDAVSNWNDTFGVEYSNLRFLQELDLSGSSGYCTMKILTTDTFKYTPYVEQLDLSECGINVILRGTFRNLVYLKYLDLSDNRCLKLNGLANVTHDLPSTSIQILRMNKIHQTFDLNTIMTKCYIKPLRGTNITEIHLNSNRLQLVEQGAIKFLPYTLKILSIADNEFSYGKYLNDIIKLTVHEANVSYMDMSHNIMEPDEPCDYTLVSSSPCNNYPDMNKNVTFKGRNSNNGTRYFPFASFGRHQVPVPYQLRKLHLRTSKLRYYLPEMNFSINMLDYVDLSSNTFYDWQGPIWNLNRLKFLNLSNNYCWKVSNKFFIGMTNLTTLLIQNNLLGFILPSDNDGKILAPLTNLKVLDLANNRITSLSSAFLNGQKQLRTLNLSGNMLENVVFEIEHMTKLSHLDLSNNRLSLLDIVFTKQLDKISKTIPSLTVELSDNPIKCTCESIEFIQWLSITKVHVRNKFQRECRSLSMHLNSSNVIYDHLKKTCSSYTTTIIAVGSWVAMFAIVITAGIVFRYRWKLRYAYYIVKGKHHGQIKPLGIDDNFQYDAFVSYADEDCTFVHTQFIKHLENDRNIRCCIHKRDFLVGNDIATNITSAIHNSRKTVVILSKHFLESDWCLFEFNMAKMESIYSRSKENIILLVFLEQISSKDLPLNILELIQSKSYIEYPNDEYGDVVFWDKLKETLSV